MTQQNTFKGFVESSVKPKWRESEARFLQMIKSDAFMSSSIQALSWIKAFLHEVVSNTIKVKCVFWQEAETEKQKTKSDVY